jgi:hypothetical protein
MKAGRRWRFLINTAANYWRAALVALIAVAALAGLLTFRLAALTSNLFSTEEVTARADATSLHRLQENPLFGPHKAIQLVLQHTHHYGPVAMRSVSVFIGLLVILSFYYTLYRWYTTRVAVLGTLLIATSSWFLHAVRLATPDAMFLLLLALFAIGAGLHHLRIKRLSVVLAVTATAVLLYVPGMVWFIVPVFIWQQKRLRKIMSRLKWWHSGLLFLLALGLIAPLVYTFTKEPWLYKTWLGLPDRWPSPTQAGRNAGRILSQLFWRGPQDSSKWLDHLPLLDWFGSVMFIIGLYAHRFKLRLDRTWLFLYIAIIGILLITIGGPVSIVIFLPFIYLLIGSGIALMLQQWFTVFPRNPFARSVGATLVVLAVLASCFYQINHYFVAWPHNSQTKSAFQQRP